MAVLKKILRPLYHRAFRAQLRVRCWLADRSVKPSDTLPPALLRYRVSELIPADMFLSVGKGCAMHIETQVRAMGARLADAERVLDFGCGCGRTIRWLIEMYPLTRFYGADVDGKAIEWCARHLAGEFEHSNPEPPLPYPSSFFDVVYCFSVFTHIDERMQDLWLAELNRILKPGGILILTVHGERAASKLPGDAAETLLRYGFVHARSQKLAGLMPDWYNTTWHTQAYIEARVGARFNDVRYVVYPESFQNMVVARKG